MLFGASAVLAGTPKLISASRIGTAGDDSIEDVAIGQDGLIYVVGNSATPLPEFEGAKVVRLPGDPEPKDWTYGSGFVAVLDADGSKVKMLASFPRGVAKLTSIQLSKNGIYVSGYGSPGMEPVIGPLGGVMAKASFEQRKLKTWCPPEHHSEPLRKDENDQRGVPFVVRLTADLGRIDAGTFLEGWQSTWHVPRPLGEDHFQPTSIAVLSSGDVVVCHDGGYNKFPPASKQCGFEEFYDVPDYLSRLTPDLKGRVWKTAIYTPSIDAEKVNRFQKNSTHFTMKWGSPPVKWTLPHLGNTRTFRMRVDGKDNIYLCGWSPTRTAAEPWWSSFFFRYSPEGKEVWRAWTPDPMSGPDSRMNHLVSDAAVRSVNIDEQGNVLASMIGDGGNNILRQDPRDYTKPTDRLKGTLSGFRGRVLFWGGVSRLDAGTRELLGGYQLSAYGQVGGGRRRAPAQSGYKSTWANDLTDMGGGRVLAVGRNTGNFVSTRDAWFESKPGGLVMLFDREFSPVFSSTVADADLNTVARRGTRAVVVGVARSDAVPTAGGMGPKPLGASDGYIMVIDAPLPEDK